ncbi:MAG: hypothetical protein GKR91_01035 [Pseudomonadales bacterium]|nr:hypothetical protein [Pseudomonadales bacterium]
MLEVTLDTYNEAALQALNGNNKNLALHYFSTALSRIQQSSDQGTSTERTNYFARKVEQLQSGVTAENSDRSSIDEALPDARVLAEWEALEQKQTDWQKKRY